MSDLIDSLSRNLRGYWCPMIQYGGLTLRDQTRFKNHGTLTNFDATINNDWIMSRVRGRSGRVLDFDGTNDYVSIGDRPSFRLGVQTISTWFKIGSQASPKVIYSSYSQNTAVAGVAFGLNVAANAVNQMVCVVGRNTGTNSADFGVWIATGTVADNNWHNVACLIAVDGSVRFFIDGLEVTSTRNFGSTVAPGYATNNYVNIGAEQTNATTLGKYWPGQLPELAIWSRILTPGEIQKLYRLGPGWYQPQLPRQIPYSEQQAAGFKAYWARRQSQLIGGGV